MGTNMFYEFIDDLLWLYSCARCSGGPGPTFDAITAMVAEYTDNADVYSDGSPLSWPDVPGGR